MRNVQFVVGEETENESKQEGEGWTGIAGCIIPEKGTDRSSRHRAFAFVSFVGVVLIVVVVDCECGHFALHSWSHIYAQ